MNQRVLKLMERLALDQCEAVLVHNPSNMFYLSGYTGEGLVLIGREMQTIITDFRYTEQAEKQAPGFSVEMTEKGVSHEAIVGRLCAEHEIGALYYEDDYLTVRSFESCRKAVPGVEWKSLHEEVQHIRQIKDEDELSRIAEACRITSEAFERLLPEIKEGVTEKELALKLEFDMLTHGATGLAFSTIVAAGANGSLPHAVPGDYKVRLGDMITFDFGAKYNGYCADMTRTVALGQPSDEMRKVYQTVLTAQQTARDAVMAGKCCKDIDAIARDYIYSHGYEGRFGHGLGHSVGIDIHEEPRLSMTCSAILEENQIMTVEPGIYLPGVGGVRIEDSVIVKKDGCIPLTSPTRELIIL
ncbi:MAG: aminopeptidase P family protein [Eubacteriales bacterium]|mgnify:FL=1|nr:aminopeptidase P family protein [Eubacteriales bacterium]